MREVLHGYLQHIRREALEAYRFRSLMYVLQAPHLGKGQQIDKPSIPSILKEPKDGD